MDATLYFCVEKQLIKNEMILQRGNLSFLDEIDIWQKKKKVENIIITRKQKRTIFPKRGINIFICYLLIFFNKENYYAVLKKENLFFQFFSTIQRMVFSFFSIYFSFFFFFFINDIFNNKKTKKKNSFNFFNEFF